MKVYYQLRGKSSPSTIYLRAQDESTEIKMKTPYSIDPANWERGKIKLHRIGREVTKENHDKRKANKRLRELQNDLSKLADRIIENYNGELSKEWLSEQIDPTPSPTTVADYVGTYFHLTNLRPRTKKKVQSIVNRIGNLKLSDVNKTTRKKLIQDLKAKGYAHNTIAKTLKVLQTLCRHAHDNGFEVHPDSQNIAKGLTYEKSPIVYLTETEIERIERVELEGNLAIARDWLVISCHTGQRMGDLFTFDKKMITTQNSMRFLSITQSKGTKPVLIPITPPVEAVLRRYNGHFPPVIADNPASNEVLYNRLIKRVAKEAEIDTLVEANIRNKKTKRYEIAEVEKWKAVSSHIGRRSFASNHYGKIPTPLLMSVTGHATEKQFLEYIGKPQADNAVEVARQLRAYYLSKSNLEIVSKSS